MNQTSKVARSMNLGWLCGFRNYNRVVSSTFKPASFRAFTPISTEQRRFGSSGDRFTINDHTQAYITRMRRQPYENIPDENPWSDSNEYNDNFRERLDEMGYEAHCNDRLYIAKNRARSEEQEYQREREARRMLAKKRFQEHFADADKEQEPRRRSVSQDPAEHQRRQLMIIEQNRRRFQTRSEAMRENSAKEFRKEQDRIKLVEARRAMEQVEVESEWLKKKQADEEAQYWHTWHTCPQFREPETDEMVKPHSRRKKVVVHPPWYPRDTQRRRYHKAAFPLKSRMILMLRKRRPSSLEKQFHKFAREQQQAWLELPEPQTTLQTEKVEKAQQVTPLPHEQPKRLVPEKEDDVPSRKRKVQRRSVKPPVFKIMVKTRQPVNRPAAPVPSFSGNLGLKPHSLGASEYTGGLHCSISDVWRKFSGYQ